MSDGPTILKGGVPCVVNSPGWRRPVDVSLRATIGASGDPTEVSTISGGNAGTTTGITIARTNAGIYTITTPVCKAYRRILISVRPDDPTDISDGRHVNIDDGNTDATAGTIRFYTASFDGTEDADEEVVDGSVITADFEMEV